MLTIEPYQRLYDELLHYIILSRPSKECQNEIHLQLSVLNAERAIVHHGRELVISNLQEIVDKQEPLFGIAAKELFILKSSKNIIWN